jgi:hypothetical protein
VIPFAAIGRDHPVVETGSRVPGVRHPRADGARVEGRFVGDDVLGVQPVDAMVRREKASAAGKPRVAESQQSSIWPSRSMPQ